jgi:Mn2+/Fe2+ NRAMP family transporter
VSPRCTPKAVIGRRERDHRGGQERADEAQPEERRRCIAGQGAQGDGGVPRVVDYAGAEAFGRRADLNDSLCEAPVFYGAYCLSVALAVGLVLIPGAPIITMLVLSQALNAVLLLAILPLLRAQASDPEIMGPDRLARRDRAATAAVIALVGGCVTALAALTVAG